MAEKKAEKTKVKKTEKKKKEAPKELHYIVPLQKVNNAPKPKRARRAIKKIKEFFKKHLHLEESQIKLSGKINEAIWKKSGEKVPKKLALKAVVEKHKASIFLEEEKIEKAKKKEKTKENKKEKKETKTKGKEEKEEEAKQEKKKKEKKQREKASEASAIKRGTM